MKRRVISFFMVLALCLSLCPTRALAADGDPAAGEELDPSLCLHHPAHTADCGYVEGDPDSPCTFVCRICPIEDLIAELPPSVTADNKVQVEAQINAIFALYEELTDDEKDQLDMALCLELKDQVDAANAKVDLSGFPQDQRVTLNQDRTNAKLYSVTFPLLYDISEYSYTATTAASGAFQVQNAGELYLIGSGTITAQKGIGVEVLAGGKLYISDADLTITSSTSYALKLASGAAARLSSGTYTGKTAAISTADGRFGDLLESGYAFFDASGNPIPLTAVVSEKTVVVKRCTDHLYGYTHNNGFPTHAWTCLACGAAAASEPCTFLFDENGHAECGDCGDTITIAVNQSSLGDLVYNSSNQPASVDISVTLGDGTTLIKDRDYTVSHSTRTDVGEITITVTGITYSGTFTKTYHVTQAEPGIAWAQTALSVDYNGSPVPVSALPGVNITAYEDLSGSLRYSYKGAGDADFTDGLPTNEGTYEIKASLPEQHNYKAVETNPCLQLTIRPISALINPPQAATLVYNEESQTLVIPGTVRDGAVIKYARSADGPFSPDLPAGVNAGEYGVWYCVEKAENYTEIPATKIPDVRIQRKPISPTIVLPPPFVFDGLRKEPEITIKDEKTVLGDEQYTIDWLTDWTYAGTHRAVITGAEDGNYKFTAPIELEIKEANQNPFKITGTPSTVYYDDTITSLDTTGGSGSGSVKWTLSGGTNSSIDQTTGKLQIQDIGTLTVTAERTADNYEVIKDTWTFTVAPRPVVNPVITLAGLTSYTVPYDGTAQTPAVAIKDLGKTIDPSQYDVDYSKNTNAGTAIVTIRGKNGGNYAINDTVTFEITKVEAQFSTSPEAKPGLVYNGSPQKLVSAGASSHGAVVYALNDGAYTDEIPTGTGKGSYTVYAKVRGDENHEDSVVKEIPVSIGINNVNKPTVELSSSRFQYNGSEQKPEVKVRDDNGDLIPSDEYTVTYGGDAENDTIKLGTYTITITNREKNYSFTQQTRTVTIFAADQTALTITGKPNTVYFGDTIQLSTTGGSGNGTVTWSIEEGDGLITKGASEGQFQIIGVGSITIKAARTPAADSGYADVEDQWQFYAYKRPVTAELTAEDKTYDKSTDAKLTVTLLGTGITIENVPGTFDTPDVGDNKTVTIDRQGIPDDVTALYDITCPDTTTASIHRAKAELEVWPRVPDLVYNGAEQPLLIGGTTVGGIGQVEYSLSEDGEYSPEIPTATDAGEYIVWYKVADDPNYVGISQLSKPVTIAKADPHIITPPAATEITPEQTLSDSTLSGGTVEGDVPGHFDWKDGTIKPVNGQSYTVIFTPDNTNNYNTAEIDVLVTVTDPAVGGGDEGDGGDGGGDNGDNGDGGDGGSDSGDNGDGSGSSGDSNPESSGSGDSNPGSSGSSGSSTSSQPATNGSSAASTPAQSASMQTSVQNGAAATVLNTATASRLVSEAIANQSEAVVIKPEITSSVSKANVSIPTSMVSQLGSRTSANLTVSTPIADVTIPNAALDTLSSAGSTVNVSTEQVENTFSLTLSANGQSIDSIPGGLTLTVPVEEPTPGTVAVLLNDDGTSETIRKAVAEDGKISVQLDGSATVAIVDNSKEFTDVPAESWACDAIAFASAHELFNGTSETTFSPEQPMSRAMLATVLYNLEGCPDQDSASGFSDVSSDAWYADSVSWAAENGITNGYSDDEFGPDDNVTREQFAVMLWKYAGSPAADGAALDFTDADQVSSYALEALRWAATNGILNGHDDGRLDPGGAATRAQAAQMLKNFMENT